MKSRFLQLPAALLASGIMFAQTPGGPLIEPVTEPAAASEIPEIPPAGADLPDALPGDARPADIPAPGELPPPPPAPGQLVEPTEAPDPNAPLGGPPVAGESQEMTKSDEGYIIKDAGLNDIFQFLAKAAGRQYFHNAKIAGPEYLVTGHLNDGNPLQQMEELSFMYGLSLHTKGDTIYALTQAQLAQLPSAEFHYQLRYLRPTDIKQIQELIKPMLSPGTGIVNFEPKTNTIVIIDTATHIEQARDLLHGIDRAQGQIVVETKILRINSSAAERTGVNWASSLGSNGVSIGVARDLNSVFGLPSLSSLGGGAAGGTGGPDAGSSASSNLVLSPLQLNGVLRALDEGGLASQVSNPTLITEDNEQATISIIDRIPIITTTSTANTSGGNPTVTEEVRYKIGQDDKGIEDAMNNREIGISLVVTPTLLPDGTIRMKLRPRSAQIIDYVVSLTGNRYPHVNESMVETLARVPDGYSLVVGGFYGESQNTNKTKVPLLGDVPVLNFFFKSKEATKEKTSLVFVVTPKSYDPSSGGANNRASTTVRSTTVLDCDHDWIDPHNPGPAHEANLRRTVRGLQPTEAPYYPTARELAPRQAPPVRRTTTTHRFSRGGMR